MGNRAVITTTDNYMKGHGIGVYLHWNGGYDSVSGFLAYCKEKGYRSPEADGYGWARLCQVIGNFFGGTLSVGIEEFSYVEEGSCGDNGLYLIDNWEITGRRYACCSEQKEYPLREMLEDINASQPEGEQLPEGYFTAELVPRQILLVGDEIYYRMPNGSIEKTEILGFGEDKTLNGTNVKGIPYIGLFGDNPSSNINNYLTDDYYRLVGEI